MALSVKILLVLDLYEGFWNITTVSQVETIKTFCDRISYRDHLGPKPKGLLPTTKTRLGNKGGREGRRDLVTEET